MNTEKALLRIFVFCFIVSLTIKNAHAQTPPDSVSYVHPFIHTLEADFRPGYVLSTHKFLRGENMRSQPIRHSFSGHIKYSFRFRPNTYVGRIYGAPHQGIGVAYYSFGDRKQLGNPFAMYLFQGARMAQITPRLSLNYEWNFGLSAGWSPYHPDNNPHNKVIGSKMNAYMNTNFYLTQTLSERFDVVSGVSLTHFSNGNTHFPNAGVNTFDVKVGLMYHFNRGQFTSRPLYEPPIPQFPRHVSFDVVLFGSWRRKGVMLEEKALASPHIYAVTGFNIAPMYNFGYKLRAGLSLDGVYDSSVNVYTEHYIVPVGGHNPGYTFYKPPMHKQLALGISARAEYVMPYFTVGVGIGGNVWHGGGDDVTGLYQILALKVELTRHSFLHIGYNLQNFKNPNYLMLGIGYRFNNKYPVFYR